MKDRPTVAIIGGGIIGCSIAYELAKKGLHPIVIDKGPLLKEASIAAAGMLGAYNETMSPGPFFELCQQSLSMYRAWTEELQELTGVDSQYVDQGILRLSLTEKDEQELKQRLEWIGNGISWLTPEEVRKLEPAVGEEVRGGVYYEEDHQVQPPLLAKALESALRQLNCTVEAWNPVLGLLVEGNQVKGVSTANGKIFADVTVIAAGAWSSALLEPLGIEISVFPVKGQVYALRPRSHLISRTVCVHGCYLVPKRDGSIVIGATQESAGFDKTPTPFSITALHQTARRLVPELDRAEWIATWTGLRPGTGDHLPFLGWIPGIEQLAVATGHFRNGILLAPVTGKVMAELIAGQRPSFDLSPFQIRR